VLKLSYHFYAHSHEFNQVKQPPNLGNSRSNKIGEKGRKRRKKSNPNHIRT
jgi:hypothetical protein